MKEFVSWRARSGEVSTSVSAWIALWYVGVTEPRCPTGAAEFSLLWFRLSTGVFDLLWVMAGTLRIGGDRLPCDGGVENVVPELSWEVGVIDVVFSGEPEIDWACSSKTNDGVAVVASAAEAKS